MISYFNFIFEFADGVKLFMLLSIVIFILLFKCSSYNKQVSFCILFISKKGKFVEDSSKEPFDCVIFIIQFAFLAKVGLHFQMNCIIVCFGYDRDHEVEKNNDHIYVVYQPYKPKHKSHKVNFYLLIALVVFKKLPIFVIRNFYISNRISIRINE